MDLYRDRSINICRECYEEIRNILKNGVNITPNLEKSYPCDLFNLSCHSDDNMQILVNCKYYYTNEKENQIALKLTNDSRRFLLKEIQRLKKSLL